MKNTALKIVGSVTLIAVMLSGSVLADLVSLANFNTNQFVSKSETENAANDQLQTLLAKGRNQPLSPAENKKLQQLLLSSAKSGGSNSQTTAPAESATTGAGQTQMQPRPIAGASVQDQAFAGVTQKLMPMTPEQIKMLKQMYNDRMKASLANPSGAPKPVSSSMSVNLSPGATPPVIRCSAGFISTLVFLDASGQPWPVQAVDNGDSSSYNVKLTGNSLMLQAITHFKSANIAVMLKGLSTPVMITLVPGQKEVDYRVDMRVPKMGPNAVASVSGMPSSESPQLLNILDGVPPPDAKQVQVAGGGDSQAWVVGSKLYLRTRMTLMSPSWLQHTSSSDGMSAYQLEKSPVLLALLHGKMVRLTVEGL